MNTYNIYYKQQVIEVRAETSYHAQQEAMRILKVKNGWVLNVVLTEKNGVPVVINPGAI